MPIASHARPMVPLSMAAPTPTLRNRRKKRMPKTDQPEAAMSLVLRDNEMTLSIAAAEIKTKAEADELVEQIHKMAASLPETNQRRGKKAKSKTKPKSSRPTASRRSRDGASEAGDDEASGVATS